MMKSLVVAVLVVLAGCGTTEVQPFEASPVKIQELKDETQLVVNDLAKAIITEDVELFRSHFLPYVTHHVRSGTEDLFIKTQRESLRNHHGDTIPRVMDVRYERDMDHVSVSIWMEKLGQISPKRLYFTRLDDGKLYYDGIHFSGKDGIELDGTGTPVRGPNNVLRQAMDYGDIWPLRNWDYNNASNYNGYIGVTASTKQTANSPGCNAGDNCNGCPGCSLSTFCELPDATGGGPFLAGQMTYVSHAPGGWTGTRAFDSRATPSGTLNFSVAEFYINVGTRTCSTGTTFAMNLSPWCCWMSGWGPDFTWNSSAPNGALPQCVSSYCIP